MTFEFTREQREAWRVFRPIALEKWLECALEDFDEAAARFDEREGTCGIEPLSEEHAWLIILCKQGRGVYSRDFEFLEKFPQFGNIYTAREVLANLNAKCKVQK